MNVIYTKNALKHMQMLDKALRERIKAAIGKIPQGDIKKLQGHTNTYRLRVGDYRILFSLGDNALTVNDVLPRGSAYKR